MDEFNQSVDQAQNKDEEKKIDSTEEIIALRDKQKENGEPIYWYVVHTYSGYEHKVKANLEQRRESMGMKEYIFEVVVPENEATKTGPNGELKRVIENDFPGYVLVEMIMSDEAWYVVRNTPGVTGFLGSHGQGSKPNPMTQDEIDRILRRMGVVEHHVDNLDVRVGEVVKIVGGPFSGMEAVVDEIDRDKREVRSKIEVFGRETPAEISFDDIELI